MITRHGVTTRPNFRHAYQETVRELVSTLRKLRSAGSTIYRIAAGSRPVNPSRMTDPAIELAAERAASRTIDRAINIYNAKGG